MNDRTTVLEDARIRRAARILDAGKTPRATRQHPDNCPCKRCETTEKTP